MRIIIKCPETEIFINNFFIRIMTTVISAQLENFYNFEKTYQNKHNFNDHFLMQNKIFKKIFEKNTENIYDPNRYENIYFDFRQWVFLSIRPYRKDFKKFLAPLALCFFLDLLEKGYFIDAKIFLTNFKEDLRHSSLDLRIELMENLHFLKINGKNLFKTLSRLIFKIKLNSHSFDIILEYFNGKNFLEFFKFLNQKFKIVIIKNTTLKYENFRQATESDTPLYKKIEEEEDYAKKKRKKEKSILTFDKTKRLCEMNGFKTANETKIFKIIQLISKNDLLLNSVQISNNENSLIAGWQNGSISCFDKINEPLRNTFSLLKSHKTSVYLTKYSMCDKFFLTGSLDGELKMWSSTSKNIVLKYESGNQPIWDAAFSKNGSHFLTGSANNTVGLCIIDQKFPLRVFVGHSSDVNVVRWHPSCTLMASGSRDSSCFLWDIRSAKVITKINNFGSPIHALEFSSSGFDLAISGLVNKINFWDIRMSKIRKTIVDQFDSNCITNLAFSRNNKYFSYTLGNGNIGFLQDYCSNILFSQKLLITKNACAEIIKTKCKRIFETKFSSLNRLIVVGT